MGVGNSYFDFKQFRISQEGCAMKVTTDACMQGAWTPVTNNVKRVLDIGTGTGLLSLMIAQKSKDVIIDAAEIDIDAARQAQVNIAASPWADRINVLTCDINKFQTDNKYDLIICNPPFFNNSLLSGKEAKNKARHTVTLSYENLFDAIKALLADNGTASILLPVPEASIWEELVIGSGWHVVNTLSVKHRDNATVKRKVIIISNTPPETLRSQTLVIQENNSSYTEIFTTLLAPYYLNL
ncbi:methyltransferase [Flavipsychrobacter stenotrophus]|uniref:tRNA1(Val) (adenine(37)-N6)-methyltransferase n=1 Tax=Flavipsychrobacter stenotrophus TaxID=2077091 RepID=A0A2S7SSY2_9BACT|nr:methyltransferase [Flavipsychrobacter stenotrophus]PQJ10039.1 methyltransferase [Flavipsychrobacter stenotrophus]